MAQVKVYKTNPIDIPKSSSIQKHFPRFHEISSDDRNKVDLTTIFFDVFVSPKKNSVVALGPQLLNLKEHLLPMTIEVNGELVDYRMQQIKHIVFVETDELAETLAGEIKVEFKFRSFSQTVGLLPELDSHSEFSRDNHCLTLSTLQKDNPILWISDWLTWYCRSFGVSRLVLYDNASSNRLELLEYLRQCSLDLNVIFVDWPFPHGFEPYKYCQRGALNHCRIRFPVSNGYCLNFDVDEYLWFLGKNLIQYLNQNTNYPRPGAIGIRQYIVSARKPPF